MSNHRQQYAELHPGEKAPGAFEMAGYALAAVSLILAMLAL